MGGMSFEPANHTRGSHGYDRCRNLRNPPRGFEVIPAARRPEVIGERAVRIRLEYLRTMGKTVAGADPDWVINAASVSDVDTCERQPRRAKAVNADADLALACAFQDQGAHLLQLSADYVFDRQARPYWETDTPSKLMRMGGLSSLAR